MITQEQKDQLEMAYQQNAAIPLIILKAALVLGDADTVLHIVTEMADRYDEEVQAEFCMIKDAVEAVVAMTATAMPADATVH